MQDVDQEDGDAEKGSFMDSSRNYRDTQPGGAGLDVDMYGLSMNDRDKDGMCIPKCLAKPFLSVSHTNGVLPWIKCGLTRPSAPQRPFCRHVDRRVPDSLPHTHTLSFAYRCL